MRPEDLLQRLQQQSIPHAQHHQQAPTLVRTIDACMPRVYRAADRCPAARLSAEAPLAIPATSAANRGTHSTSTAVTVPAALPGDAAHPSAPTASPVYVPFVVNSSWPLIHSLIVMNSDAAAAVDAESSSTPALECPAGCEGYACCIIDYISNMIPPDCEVAINPEKIEAHLWSKANTLLTIQASCYP